MRGDHETGLLSAVTVLFERKSRRAEIGMYVSGQAAWCFLRKVPSLFSGILLTFQAIDRRWIPSVPLGDVLIFSAASSCLLGGTHSLMPLQSASPKESSTERTHPSPHADHISSSASDRHGRAASSERNDGGLLGFVCGSDNTVEALALRYKRIFRWIEQISAVRLPEGVKTTIAATARAAAMG